MKALWISLAITVPIILAGMVVYLRHMVPSQTWRLLGFRSLQFLCVGHAVAITALYFYYDNHHWGPDESLRGKHLFMALFPWDLLIWPAWGLILWAIGARRWRLALPLIAGLVALAPLSPLLVFWVAYGGWRG